MIPFYRRKRPFPCPKHFIRNDYLRFIYCSLFSEFSFDELKEFWSRYEITLDNKELSLRETIEHIWKVDNLSSFEYVFSVLNSLEPFFVSKGKDLKKFLSTNVYKKQFGTTVIPRLAVWAMEPFLLTFCGENDDSRALFLKYVHILNDRIRPGTLQQLVKIETVCEKKKGLVVFAPDPTFGRDFSWVDGELYFAITFQFGPTRFGIASYFAYEMVSECQAAIERVQEGVNANIHLNNFLINGKIHGEEKLFSEFLKNHQIPLDKILSYPDKSIVEITKDYFCPVRKRIVLHKGCAYGAPVYMYTMIYPAKRVKRYSLTDLLNDVMKNADAKRDFVNQKHEEFIRLLDTVFTFRYDAQSGYIFLNDKVITRGVQANILRKIVKTAFETNRFLFEHKEFIGEQQFITDPLNTGFVTRLYRIDARLRKISPYICLEKPEKGKFELKSSLPVKYTELSPA